MKQRQRQLRYEGVVKMNCDGLMKHGVLMKHDGLMIANVFSVAFAVFPVAVAVAVALVLISTFQESELQKSPCSYFLYLLYFLYHNVSFV